MNNLIIIALLIAAALLALSVCLRKKGKSSCSGSCGSCSGTCCSGCAYSEKPKAPKHSTEKPGEAEQQDEPSEPKA